MDPSKPSIKPKVGAAQVSQASPALKREPKTSFAATLAAKNETLAKPEAEAEALQIAEEHLAVQLARTVLSAPKAKKRQVEKADMESESEG